MLLVHNRSASNRVDQCVTPSFFGGGVNVTLGLPFVRTSVDHGTAFDLVVDAAKARAADPGSLYAAIDLAVDLAARRGA